MTTWDSRTLVFRRKVLFALAAHTHVRKRDLDSQSSRPRDPSWFVFMTGTRELLSFVEMCFLPWPLTPMLGNRISIRNPHIPVTHPDSYSWQHGTHKLLSFVEMCVLPWPLMTMLGNGISICDPWQIVTMPYIDVSDRWYVFYLLMHFFNAI